MLPIITHITISTFTCHHYRHLRTSLNWFSISVQWIFHSEFEFVAVNLNSTAWGEGRREGGYDRAPLCRPALCLHYCDWLVTIELSMYQLLSRGDWASAALTIFQQGPDKIIVAAERAGEYAVNTQAWPDTLRRPAARHSDTSQIRISKSSLVNAHKERTLHPTSPADFVHFNAEYLISRALSEWQGSVTSLSITTIISDRVLEIGYLEHISPLHYALIITGLEPWALCLKTILFDLQIWIYLQQWIQDFRGWKMHLCGLDGTDYFQPHLSSLFYRTAWNADAV